MAYFDNHIHRPVCEVYLQVALNLMGEANTEEPFNLEGKALENYNVSSFLNGTLEQFSSASWMVCQISARLLLWKL